METVQSWRSRNFHHFSPTLLFNLILRPKVARVAFPNIKQTKHPDLTFLIMLTSCLALKHWMHSISWRIFLSNMGRLQVLVLKHLMHSISFRIFLSNMGRLRVLEIVAEKAPLSLPSSNSLFSWCLKGKTNIWRQASIRGDMSYLLSSVSIIYSLLSLSRIYHYICLSHLVGGAWKGRLTYVDRRQ